MPFISDVRHVMLVYNPATLSFDAWDGSLTAGALVIGAVTQSGTWTVQPGNTPNATAWKVDGSAVTQPVSLASVPSHAVTGPITDAELRAAAVPVSLASLPPLADTTTAGTFDGVND